MFGITLCYLFYLTLNSKDCSKIFLCKNKIINLNENVWDFLHAFWSEKQIYFSMWIILCQNNKTLKGHSGVIRYFKIKLTVFRDHKIPVWFKKY